MTPTGAYLAGIRIFPIKSLDAVDLHGVDILPGGALAHDREFALMDDDGRFINAKRFALVQRLRCAWDRERQTLCLHVDGAGNEARFRLPSEQAALEDWLTVCFDQPVTLARNPGGGFPDDAQASGPTLISTATLEEVASWFPGVTVDETRRRFRANLEIGGVPAFWEDRLFGAAGETVPFEIGDTLFHGVNPCQRCIVPTRDSFSGEAWPEFSQTFRARREATLPPWADRSRFNHFYRLAVNTRAPASEAGKSVRVGDILSL